ncbi:S41 family peptidase [Roseivirga pacifica]|uniref:S41 family peptidase n=1 Tax=Roseivirga pacifica TaxID=1267423 RepID=UPI003BA9BCCC
MKTAIISILFIFLVLPVFAQNSCDCNADLEFVKAQLENTPSFKDQIKGKQEMEFQALVESLKSEEQLSIHECFWRLNRLIGVLRDKHISVAYQTKENINPFDGLKVEKMEGQETQLSQKSFRDVEGIYSVSDKLEIGVYRTEVVDSLVGVVLKSETATWEKGEVCMILKETDLDNQFDLMMSFDKKNMYFRRSFLFQEGSFFANLKKLRSPSVNQALVDPDATPYTLDQLDGVSYVWFNSFGSSSDNWKKRDAFLEELSETEIGSTLIIDLRNNGGGSDKISKSIFKALKKASKGKEVYVLTNYFTASNGEIFTLRAKQEMDATHVGWRTNGALAYGVNYGTTYELPSGYFSIRPTDMNNRKYHDYEVVGVVPDVELDYWVDWKVQLKELLNEPS